MVQKYPVEVSKVIDGDTFVGIVTVKAMEAEVMFRDQHFRMVSIDAPELRGDTREFGLQARDYLAQLIQGKTAQVQLQGRDKYGRWLVIVWHGGLQLNEHMVNKGFAKWREY